MKVLNTDEIQKHLKKLSGWSVDSSGARIEKKYVFENFTDAVCFLNQIAEIAEEENHHPDLHLTNYKHLLVAVTTHAESGLTKKDFILAEKIDRR